MCFRTVNKLLKVMVHMQETDSSNAFPLSNSIGDTYSHFELLVI